MFSERSDRATKVSQRLKNHYNGLFGLLYMRQNVFIIGATGKVGATLVRQIYERGDTDTSLHANPTRVVGLASSSSYIYSDRGIRHKDALKFIATKNGHSYNGLDDLVSLVKKRRDDLIFVDATALNEPMLAFHKKIIGEISCRIVTANKNPIAYSDYKTFRFLTKEPRRYGYRCSVMAGADAVPFLRDLRDVEDRPSIIEGCFSGTLGYITSMLEKNIPFSTILKRAVDNGYTEPDPRDDLNGLDVARKLVVLARSAGYPADLQHFKVQPFIASGYFKDESIDAFLRSAGTLDAYFAREVQKAKQNNSVLRYVASMHIKGNKPLLVVRLRRVLKDSELGSLHGTANKIIIVSKTYGKDRPYVVQGPGAGLDVTAQNIRRDLLYLFERRLVA